ncbi:DHA2 family efflux MFS transporter permease subunit [Halobacillus rhizosphaerae]|uniref:DHA2 family efflux MFS transporter permease subunit n=1 Tax=Halobacillus rhizosphaerae TaxID=3064889 RepID=UPI00398ABD88
MTKRTETLIISAMILGIFMASLDNTIVSASINQVIKDIGGFEQMSWVFTAYILASTSTMLVFGKLSDIYGRKLFFLTGIVLFLLGSALCGMAQNIDQLIFYRTIQGVGSGALLPISFTIIFSIFTDPTKAAKMTGIFAGVFGLSSVLGPQLGTWISEGLSWRWCFYVNLPLGILSFLILFFALIETKSNLKPKIDYLGTILLITTTIAVMLAFEWGGKKYDWSSTVILGLFGVFTVGIILFIFTEKRAKEPILPLHLFKDKVISGTSFIVFCQGVLMFSAITYIPILAVGVLGRHGSNGLLTPMMLSLMAGASLGGILMTKFSFRTFYLFVMGMGIVTSGLLFMVGPDTPFFEVVLLMILLGSCGIGPLMSVAQNAVANTIPKQYLGIANSLVAFFRNLGGIFGASIMATIVNNYVQQQMTGKGSFSNPDALLQEQSSLQIPAPVLHVLRGVLSDAIGHGFLFALIVCGIGFIISMFIGNARFTYKGEKEKATEV